MSALLDLDPLPILVATTKIGGDSPVPEDFRRPVRPKRHPPHDASIETATADALTIYLREIRSFSLLSIQEEVALAKRVRRGDSAARERMICANLRLVVAIARHYEGLGLPLLDIIAEGNLGLMEAVDHFNPTKGAKFSYYASWWIRQSIRRALCAHVGPSACPSARPTNSSNWPGQKENSGRTWNANRRVDEVATESRLSWRRFVALRALSRSPFCLDAPVSDQNRTPLGEVLPDRHSAAPDIQFSESELLKIVGGLMNRLSPREATILRHRFGLDGDKPMTLERVSTKIGVNRERVRQIQVIALTKLRTMLCEWDERPQPNTAPPPSFGFEQAMRLNGGNGKHHRAGLCNGRAFRLNALFRTHSALGEQGEWKRRGANNWNRMQH